MNFFNIFLIISFEFIFSSYREINLYQVLYRENFGPFFVDFKTLRQENRSLNIGLREINGKTEIQYLKWIFGCDFSIGKEIRAYPVPKRELFAYFKRSILSNLEIQCGYYIFNLYNLQNEIINNGWEISLKKENVFGFKINRKTLSFENSLFLKKKFYLTSHLDLCLKFDYKNDGYEIWGEKERRNIYSNSVNFEYDKSPFLFNFGFSIENKNYKLNELKSVENSKINFSFKYDKNNFFFEFLKSYFQDYFKLIRKSVWYDLYNFNAGFNFDFFQNFYFRNFFSFYLEKVYYEKSFRPDDYDFLNLWVKPELVFDSIIFYFSYRNLRKVYINSIHSANSHNREKYILGVDFPIFSNFRLKNEIFVDYLLYDFLFENNSLIRGWSIGLKDSTIFNINFLLEQKGLFYRDTFYINKKRTILKFHYEIPLFYSFILFFDKTMIFVFYPEHFYEWEKGLGFKYLSELGECKVIFYQRHDGNKYWDLYLSFSFQF